MKQLVLKFSSSQPLNTGRHGLHEAATELLDFIRKD